MKIEREEVSWAAGFFDGEGTCHTGVSPTSISFRCRVSQVRKEPLERFYKAVLSLGKLKYGQKNHGLGKQPINHWYTSSWKDSQAVIAILWNFLSEPKKEQIESQFKKYIELTANKRPIKRKKNNKESTH